MMGGEGETWLLPALLKKRVSKASNMKQLQAVPQVVTILKREREKKEKRRQVSRNLARLRYLVAETRETIKQQSLPQVPSVRIRIPSPSRGKNALTWLF